MKKINKQTANDLKEQFDSLGFNGWACDWDQQYVYVRRWEGEEGYYETYRVPYTINAAGKVVVDKEAEELVIKDTSYKVVPEDAEESMLSKQVAKLEKAILTLTSNFTSTKKEHAIIKQFNEIEQKVVEPLYMAANAVDAHADTYDENGVVNLTKAFNEGVDAGTIQPSLFHKHRTKTFTFGKAWYTTEPTLIGDQLFPAYQPLVETTFLNKAAFDARINGELGGLSIGAWADSEPVKDVSIKAERKLLDFSFMMKAAHLSYTCMAKGGAASLLNNKFVVKQLEAVNLIDEEAGMIENFGESFEPLLKQKAKDSEEAAPSTSTLEAQDAGVDKKTLTKGNDIEMSEDNKAVELQKQFDEYKKAVKLEKALTKYGLGDEATEQLAATLAKLEDYSVITKALDLLSAKVEEKTTEINKQADEPVVVKTALADKIEKELDGHGEETVNVEKSVVDMTKNNLKARLDRIDAKRAGDNK
jgi:hypothetical protein